MADNSFLDQKYFIDNHIYNCPFCNRRHVSYVVTDHSQFKWNEGKDCYVYFVRCNSCINVSMHLSFSEINIQRPSMHSPVWRFDFTTHAPDSLFFYSVPTSFFVLDRRVPKILRDLMTEAEGCLKSNFLTGASVCARKVVYELGILQGAKGENYDERIKSLKSVRPEIDPTFFDTLLTIQQVTSTKVHEESYDGWESKHLQLILNTLSEVLNELYVIPAIREEKRKAILELKDELLGEKAKAKPADK